MVVDMKKRMKPGVLFERKNDTVQINTECGHPVTVKVPNDRSMLSLFSENNSFNDGEVYAKDGYVYLNKKKLRKWFGARSGWNSFWPPLLDQVPRLENTYQRLSKRNNAIWRKLWDIVEQLAATSPTKKNEWQAHGKTSHRWRLYTVSRGAHSRNPNELSFGFEWLDKKPTKLIQPKLGQQLCDRDQKTHAYRWRYLVQELLNDAIIKYINKNFPDKARTCDELFEVLINGRRYIYVVKYNRHGVEEAQKLAWPGDSLNQVSIG